MHNPFAAIDARLSNIESLLLDLKHQPQTLAPAPESDQPLTVEECAEFLNLSKQTIYGLISKGELPVMKRSKRCYFHRADLLAYLQKGRKKTNAEAEAEAERHIQNQRQK